MNLTRCQKKFFHNITNNALSSLGFNIEKQNNILISIEEFQQKFSRIPYLNSSLFVFSSRFEGVGMVLIEAMACGLPVVSFDCPCGPKDIVRHDEDGILVPSGDTDSLADAMHRLMSDDGLRKDMASKAIINVRRFQLDEIAQRWKTLFNSVVYAN